MSEKTLPAFAPLADITVLELAGRPELAACGSLLAALGATVFVAEVGARHPSRTREVAGKYPVNGSDPRLIEQLTQRCDVVLTSTDLFDPDIASTRRTIHCDITAYGKAGSLRNDPDSEALIQAVAGVADTTGLPKGPPVLTGAPFVGMETAVYAAAGILSALLHRDRTGRGQEIDMALYDVAVNALLTFLPLVFTGRTARRAGNRHPTLAPWNAYQARDGWVLICAPTNDQWRRLCEVMGQPQLKDHPLFDSTTSRFENIEALDRKISEWVATLSVADCVEAVGAGGIPCSPIHTLESVTEDPNLIHRATLRTAPDGTILCRCPIRAAGFDLPDDGAVLPPGGGRSKAEEVIASTCTQSAGSARSNSLADDASLSGLRVLEIGMNTVAPLACRQLGALGADVLKVEPPSGDSNRVNTPLRDDGQSYVFALSNTDKRGIVLDLRNPDHAERLWQLIGRADVLIENLKPGSLAKLGFGARDVRARRPELVYCSVSGFGHDSVWPGRPALDTVVQALSGAMAVTLVNGIPTKAGISISDQLGGQFGLLGMLAAIRHRNLTGSGVTLDIAMQDCTVWATQRAWDDQPLPAHVLACSDGWVATEAAFDAAGYTVSDALSHCAATGVRAAAVRSVEQVVTDAHTIARDLLREVPTPDGSAWTVLGSPIRLQSTPPKVRAAMAALDWEDPSLIGSEGMLWPGREA